MSSAFRKVSPERGNARRKRAEGFVSQRWLVAAALSAAVTSSQKQKNAPIFHGCASSEQELSRREFQNTPIYIQYAKNGLRISPPQAIFSCLYVLLTLATSPPPPPAAGPPLVQSPGAPQCPRCRVLPALPPQASSRCPQKDPVCARTERRCRQPPA